MQCSCLALIQCFDSFWTSCNYHNYTPANKVWSGVLVITFSVRPSVYLPVCLYNRVRFISCYGGTGTLDVLRHTKFFYDLRMCHGFDPRSFRQVQGHEKEKFIIHVRSLSFSWRNIESSFFIKKILLLMCRCVMILTRDDFGKYEVAIRKRSEFVSGIHFSYG